MGNILIASFRPGEITKRLDSVSQYDYGKSLRIIGLDLPPLVEVHFSTQKKGGEAPRQLGTTTDGVTEVDIPDTMLANNGASYDYYIYAFVYLSDAEHGETIRQIIIPVKSRPKPADFAPPSEPDLTQKVLRELSTKLTAPSSAQVGQIFRVQSITEDGNLVLEAVDMPSGGSGGAVNDVQIDGESIVGENGVAEIPIASASNAGVLALGTGLSIVNGTMYLLQANTKQIDDRRAYYPITSSNIDYAVKAAMCDGKGEAWTADEQADARERIGLNKYELIDTIVLSEPAQIFEIATLNLKSIIARVDFADGITTYATLGITTNINGANANIPNAVCQGRGATFSLFYDEIGTTLYKSYYWSPSANNYEASECYMSPCTRITTPFFPITKLNMDFKSNVPAGTKIIIYGVRA